MSNGYFLYPKPASLHMAWTKWAGDPPALQQGQPRCGPFQKLEDKDFDCSILDVRSLDGLELGLLL